MKQLSLRLLSLPLNAFTPCLKGWWCRKDQGKPQPSSLTCTPVNKGGGEEIIRNYEVVDDLLSPGPKEVAGKVEQVNLYSCLRSTSRLDKAARSSGVSRSKPRLGNGQIIGCNPLLFRKISWYLKKLFSPKKNL